MVFCIVLPFILIHRNKNLSGYAQAKLETWAETLENFAFVDGRKDAAFELMIITLVMNRNSVGSSTDPIITVNGGYALNSPMFGIY